MDLRFSFRGPENRLVGSVGDESQFEVRAMPYIPLCMSLNLYHSIGLLRRVPVGDS